MKSFSEFFEEKEEINIKNPVNLSQAPSVIKDDVLGRSMNVFEYLIKKYPTDCLDFIKRFYERDEFVKSQYDSMKKLADTYRGNSQQYGLGYLKGDYPRTGVHD